LRVVVAHYRKMHYNELITEIQKIPFNREGIAENLSRLLKHAKYLEDRKDVDDSIAKGLLDSAPSFIRKQIERLQLHLDDEADIIAWISRSLMELLFMLRYMYSSRERYDEIIKEQLKDLKDIEKMLYPDGAPSEDAHEEIKVFHSDMKKLWEAMQGYGVDRDELKKLNQVSHYAQGAGLIDDYRHAWKIHSKYVHPTSYLLFGRRNFVYSEGVRLFFWVLAQYYTARNLRDLHKMIEAALKST
jgi:hypothetical protein